MTHPHPEDFRRLCLDAVALLEAVSETTGDGRAALLPRVDAALREIDRRLQELDLRSPDFGEEQGEIVTARSAVQAIEMDRGGPRVGELADRAAAALRRLAGG